VRCVAQARKSHSGWIKNGADHRDSRLMWEALGGFYANGRRAVGLSGAWRRLGADWDRLPVAIWLEAFD